MSTTSFDVYFPTGAGRLRAVGDWFAARAGEFTSVCWCPQGRQEFLRVTVPVSRWRRAWFELAGVPGKFLGWHEGEGHDWNGWARPAFEWGQARLVAAAMGGHFDAKANAFITCDNRPVCLTESGTEPECDQWGVWELATTRGFKVYAYPIGAAAWCWSVCEGGPV